MARNTPSSLPTKTCFNKTVEEKYWKNIVKRPFCFEKGFLFQDSTFLGYDTSISSIVEKHGWKLFCSHSGNVLPKMVREFYTHLTSPNNAFIYVRVVPVQFDKDFINSHYNLPERPDEHSEFIAKITTKGLQQVLQDLCIEGTKWTISRHNCYTIDRVALKPHCKVWYHFLKS
ncbi:hypothetical protein J1N35_022333 [Gossypium stocksii]|uniref:Putative plant transposon protein domain-containing protein n=1 Tax=Gossypium stocksii TaxID=47602 RepID=A0A9D3VHX8_9ROSI|nr:hypothetical protein J1N35_022333 [Gossypium stocksii]